MVLAGAGSGKTRVLVHRIAWLIDVHAISPSQIFAVTFTNKAAAVMKSRLEELLGFSMSGMWVGTFHGLAHRILRQHHELVGLPATFQILDSDDQLHIIKRLLKNASIDEDDWPPKKIQWFINHNKNEGRRARHLDPRTNPFDSHLITLYQDYETACQQAGVIDFAELLLLTHECLRDNPELLQQYQHRFQHILADEFQDTNTIQYAWLRLLTGKQNKIMIVGDDDQSIYGWRGAKIENIQRFEKDFAPVTTIRLEQNYRSTSAILDAANALIENNADRYSKSLWTNGKAGEPVSVYAAFNELDEARFIVGRIKEATEQGLRNSHCAILYRSNAQSRLLEEALIQARIPYRIYGGKRFFERAEIKDALAYLRLIQNRGDAAAFERIVNTPPRGIGDKTVNTIRETASAHRLTLWDAAMHLLSENKLSARAHSHIQDFLTLINSLDEAVKDLSLGELTEHVIQQSGLIPHYKKEKGERGQTRIDNLDGLIAASKDFHLAPEEDALSPLVAFLTHAALEAGEAQGEAYEDCVQLMTLHSAKGLEFPIVFLAGMEEGLFPNKRAYDEIGRLAEERRLCYVGMTRAMQRLFLTYAENRRFRGTTIYNRPSRFISEIPKSLLQEVRMKATLSRPVSNTMALGSGMMNDSGYKIGQQVKHAKYGEGIILNFDGRGAHTQIQIKFAHYGVKWFVAEKAKLETI